MRLAAAAAVVALAIALGSCTAIGIGIYGGALWINHVFALAPVYGSDLNDVTARADGDSVTVRLAYVPEDGKFLRLLLPADQTSTGESWSGDSDTLHLVVSTSDGIDIGVVQRPSYSGEPVEFKLKIGSHGKTVSKPLTGTDNAVRDLEVIEIGEGLVRLEWTEINIADYDLNGEVNVADLTPLGKYFGADRSDSNWYLAYISDGDENGAVEIPDMTPIGAHYQESLNGYVVQRNGENVLNDQGELPTIARKPSPGPSQRPVYSLQLNGSVQDAWSVAPMDSEEAVGPPAGAVHVDRMDLSVNLYISGLDMLKLDGSGVAPYGPGCSILRIIEDGDLPGRWDPSVGKGIMTTGGPNETVFNEVPRGRPLLLDIHYAPAVDLATGLSKAASTAHSVSALPPGYEVITSVPFSLAPGSQQMKLDVDITFVPVSTVEPPDTSQGYYVDLVAKQTTLDGETTRRARLHYKYGTVALDLDAPAGGGFFEPYGDSVALSDPDRDSVSQALLNRHADELLYSAGIIEPVVITGRLATYNQSAGTLMLENPELSFGPEPGSPIPDGDSVVFRFTEETAIKEFTLETEFDIRPYAFGPNDEIKLYAYQFTFPAALPVLYWVDKIVRTADN